MGWVWIHFVMGSIDYNRHPIRRMYLQGSCGSVGVGYLVGSLERSVLRVALVDAT